GARARLLVADRREGPDPAQDDSGRRAAPSPSQGVQGPAQVLRRDRRQVRAARAEPVHLGVRGRTGGGARCRQGGRRMKVAYWPGCVSRGFTPELHGSMAAVAPLLDLELIELD